jgi:hypothetical protein
MNIVIARQCITSSDIASVGYDDVTNTLDIEFHATGVYRYYSVPSGVARELITTKRPGMYFLQNIKCRYAWDPHTRLFPRPGLH